MYPKAGAKEPANAGRIHLQAGQVMGGEILQPFIKPDGQPGKRRVLKRLAPVCREYQTATSVEHLAADLLAPINSKVTRPASLEALKEFIDDHYLPMCKAGRKPSTYKSYCSAWNLVSPFVDKRLALRIVRPSDIAGILKALADEKPRAQTTLHNCRNFLSGAFRYAILTDAYPLANPVTPVKTPKGLKPGKAYAYSLEESSAIMAALPEPAKTVVMMAAFSGLRHGEIRGLKWEDITDTEIRVSRAVWGRHIGETKTEESQAPVPLLPTLRDALAAHRKRQPEGQYIFAGERCGRPMILANLVRREIKPALLKAGIKWQGWHAFRRGISSALNEMGVDDSVIQQIVRHGDVQTTQRHYIKTTTKQAQDAMTLLGSAVTKAQKQAKRRRPRKKP